MNETAHANHAAAAKAWAAASQLTSERIGSLVQRAIVGAPSLTQGEVRELAEAVHAHLLQERG